MKNITCLTVVAIALVTSASAVCTPSDGPVVQTTVYYQSDGNGYGHARGSYTDTLRCADGSGIGCGFGIDGWWEQEDSDQDDWNIYSGIIAPQPISAGSLKCSQNTPYSDDTSSELIPFGNYRWAIELYSPAGGISQITGKWNGTLLWTKYVEFTAD
jgi:hypothetical protein